VPRAKFVCGRVGHDANGMAAQPGRPALRLLSKPTAFMAANWCICMARGVIPPTRHGKGARASGSRRVSWPTHGVGGELVRGGDLLCEAETCRARRRLVVRDGDLSGEAETCRARRRLVVGILLVGNWSEMLPTGRNRDFLPVWVLTRVLSLPHLES
jgi:hypothetical protein